MRNTEKELAPEITELLERLPGEVSNFASYAETDKTIHVKLKTAAGLVYTFATMYRAKYRPKTLWLRLRRFSPDATSLDLSAHVVKSYTKNTSQHFILCASVSEALRVLAVHAKDYERLVTDGGN